MCETRACSTGSEEIPNPLLHGASTAKCPLSQELSSKVHQNGVSRKEGGRDGELSYKRNKAGS